MHEKSSRFCAEIAAKMAAFLRAMQIYIYKIRSALFPASHNLDQDLVYYRNCLSKSDDFHELV